MSITCKGVTKLGFPCTRNVKNGEYCHNHLDQEPKTKLPVVVPEEEKKDIAPKKSPSKLIKKFKIKLPVKKITITKKTINEGKGCTETKVESIEMTGISRTDSPVDMAEQLRITQEQLKAMIHQKEEEEKKRKEAEKKIETAEKKIETAEKKIKTAEKKIRTAEKKSEEQEEKIRQKTEQFTRLCTFHREVPDLYEYNKGGVIYVTTNPIMEKRFFYKIGKTQEIRGRMTQYGTAGCLTKCVYTLTFDNEVHDLGKIEAYIHERLNRLRVSPDEGFGTEVFKIHPYRLIDLLKKIGEDIHQHRTMVNEITEEMIELCVVRGDKPAPILSQIELRQKNLSDFQAGELIDFIASAVHTMTQEKLFTILLSDKKAEIENELLKVMWNVLKPHLNDTMLKLLNQKGKQEGSADNFYTKIAYPKGGNGSVSEVVDLINKAGYMIENATLFVEYFKKRQGKTYRQPVLVNPPEVAKC